MTRSKYTLVVATLLLCFIAPVGIAASIMSSPAPQALNGTAPGNTAGIIALAASDKPLASNLRHRPKRLKGFKLWKKVRKELRQQGFKFKWGWFLLGAVLGPVGFVISLFDSSDATLSALIGFSVFLAIGLIVLFTVPLITL